MLGLGRKNNPWRLSVAGKHPAFGDFLLHNLENPMVKALATWTDRGMALTKRTRSGNRFFSYRFWTQGGKKDTLVCGIIRDSSDTLGRSYPLLLMGSGAVRNWEKKWTATFQAFDPMLYEFEQMALRRFDTFMAFEAFLQAIPFNSKIFSDPMPRAFEANEGLFDPSPICKELMHQERFTLALGKETNLLPGVFNGCPLPVAAFLGGSPDTPMLTIYTRPLIPEDFNDLFSGNLKTTDL